MCRRVSIVLLMAGVLWLFGTDADAQQLVLERGEGHKDIVWHPDGTSFLTANPDARVFLRQPDGTVMQSFMADFANYEHGLYSVAWHPGGKHFATAGEDGIIRIWLRDGTRVSSIDANRAIHDIRWHPDGRRLYALQLNLVTVWDTSTGEEISRLPMAAYDPEWSPSGDRLAVASMMDTISILDADTFDVMHRLSLPVRAVYLYLAWHPDGRYIAVGDNQGRIWRVDTQSDAPAVQMADLQGSIFSLDYSPDGTRLAVGKYSEEVVILDAASGDIVQTFPEPEAVLAVAWSPDGRQLAYSGLNAPVIVPVDTRSRCFPAGTPPLIVNVTRYVLQQMNFHPPGYDVFSTSHSPCITPSRP